MIGLARLAQVGAAAGDPAAALLDRVRFGVAAGVLATAALGFAVALVWRLLARGIGADGASAVVALALAAGAWGLMHLARDRAARRAQAAVAARTALVTEIATAQAVASLPRGVIVPLAAFAAAFALARRG